jgi:hypothetical protein
MGLRGRPLHLQGPLGDALYKLDKTAGVNSWGLAGHQ